MTNKNVINSKSLAYFIMACLATAGIGDNAYGSCSETPGQLTIDVSGASASSTTDDYYVVNIPPEGGQSSTVIFVAGGSTPCPTSSEECKCEAQNTSAPPEPDGNVTYTFSNTKGSVDSQNPDTLKWVVSSSETPGEYSFRVTKASQKYKSCPEGHTGGVTAPKDNTQSSVLVKVLAVKLSSQTYESTPSDRTRSKLGVGEKVTVNILPSGTSGSWSVSGGSSNGSVSPSSGSSTTFTAPVSAGSANVQCSIHGVTLSKSFTIHEPASVTAAITSTTSVPNLPVLGPGEQGVGMRLLLTFQPIDVSFANVQFREVSGPATNIEGYFIPYTASLYHTAQDWAKITSSNTLGDAAGFYGYPSPWAYGKYTWNIPVRWRVLGETTEKTNISNFVQVCSIANSTGASTVAKLGNSHTRTP